MNAVYTKFISLILMIDHHIEKGVFFIQNLHISLTCTVVLHVTAHVIHKC